MICSASKEIYIDLPGEDKQEINDAFDKRYQIAYIKNANDSMPKFLFDSYFHCFDKICSLITKDGPVGLGAWIRYETYNFNTKSGKLLSNDELLKTLNIEKEMVKRRILDELRALDLIYCDDPFDTRPCIYDSHDSPENVAKFYSPEMNEQSLLILNDQGKLELLYSIKNTENLHIKPYDGNLSSWLFPIQLTE